MDHRVLGAVMCIVLLVTIGTATSQISVAGDFIKLDNLWKQIRNDIYSLNPGNVGIGTDSPQAKLEVGGGVRINPSDTKPTCNESIMGTLWVNNNLTKGNSLEFCKKIIIPGGGDSITVKSTTLPFEYSHMNCVENSVTNKIYCFGGYTGPPHDVIVEYDPLYDSITTKSAVLPFPRHSFGCAEDSSTHKIYCFGGIGGGLINQVVEYDTVTDTILIKSATFPMALYSNSCAEDSSTHKIYCFGGYNGAIQLRHIYEYDPVTDNIVRKTANLPSAVEDLECVENSATNKIYCFGGKTTSGLNTNLIFEYVPSSDTASTMTAIIPSPKMGISCSENSLRNRIYCFGGNPGTDQIFEYDPQFDSVTVMGLTLPSIRAESSCTEDSSTHKIYCFGGDGLGGILLNEIVEYTSIVNTTTTYNWVQVA